MAEVPELEFLRRVLVEPGLLAPERLDAWRRGWPGTGSFFAHLVEVGALARADAATLGAVFKGYVKLPPAGLLRLFKLEAPAVAAALGGQSPALSDMSNGEGTPVARQAEPESGPAPNAESARSSSPLRAAVAAAIDAALSGLPMEEADRPATGPQRSGLPQVGAFVAGYQLRARLGVGARGAVYRAWAAGQGRSVVIKLMPARGAGLASVAAQAAVHGRLRHPGVLKVLAAGEEEDLGYLVFEDLYAISLAAYLDGATPLTATRIAQFGAEVAQTLAAGAAVGVVHGDLKPGHLLVYGPDLRVKLTDFLAPGEAPSSSAYLAPERLGGARPADIRADMYSLGATLRHAATGRPPTGAAAAAGALVSSGLPAPLSRVIARLMHERPGERFASWGAVAEALLGARVLAASESMSRGTGEDGR